MRRALVLLALAAPLPATAQDLQSVVVAGGCFWCVEADFDKVDGVVETVSGYAGGDVENPTYRQVVEGGTGHREVVEITYDADTITRERIFELFLRSIDPLDAGGQFCDRGFSYSTAIYADDAAEAELARAEIAEAEEILGEEIATEVVVGAEFYRAEDYHQDFYKKSALRYETYRRGCNRDPRVREVWGDQSIFDAIG